MYADAVLAAVLKLDSDSEPLALDSECWQQYCMVCTSTLYIGKESLKKRDSKFADRLLHLMSEMFGPQNVNWSLEKDQKKIEIWVNSERAILDPHTLAVETSDDGLQHLLSTAAKRLQNTLTT